MRLREIRVIRVQNHGNSQRTYFTRYAAIDRLFTELKTALDGAAEEVTVTYDPVYGYPAQIFIDFIKLAVDDELSLAVSSFEVLE